MQRRMEGQLGRFYDEMERAGDVPALRERMGPVADGMAEAYESG